MPLYQYVDVLSYCDEISEITGLSIDLVMSIVTEAFDEVKKEKLNSLQGFKKIEEKVEEQVIYQSFFVNTKVEGANKEKQLFPVA